MSDVLLAQALPAANASPVYLAAWVAVAVIAGTPGLVGIVLAHRNRSETRRQLEVVRHEVTPNSGSSSFDILHRLAWETHTRTEPIALLVQRVALLDERVGALELTPCPFQPSED